jgi:hypothetical protein
MIRALMSHFIVGIMLMYVYRVQESLMYFVVLYGNVNISLLQSGIRKLLKLMVIFLVKFLGNILIMSSDWLFVYS